MSMEKKKFNRIKVEIGRQFRLGSLFFFFFNLIANNCFEGALLGCKKILGGVTRDKKVNVVGGAGREEGRTANGDVRQSCCLCKKIQNILDTVPHRLGVRKVFHGDSAIHHLHNAHESRADVDLKFYSLLICTLMT